MRTDHLVQRRTSRVDENRAAAHGHPCLEKSLDLQHDVRVYVQRVTTGYKIKDVADRSGFSAVTLRYDEQIGLLPESARTAAGYRLYDDDALERLAFIARAKQLGCSLDESPT